MAVCCVVTVLFPLQYDGGWMLLLRWRRRLDLFVDLRMSLQLVRPAEPLATVGDVALERFLPRVGSQMPIFVFQPVEAAVAQGTLELSYVVVGREPAVGTVHLVEHPALRGCPVGCGIARRARSRVCIYMVVVDGVVDVVVLVADDQSQLDLICRRRYCGDTMGLPQPAAQAIVLLHVCIVLLHVRIVPAPRSAARSHRATRPRRCQFCWNRR